MTISEDIKFGRAAVALGFIKPGELAQALQWQSQMRTRGISFPLAQALVERGYLDAENIEIIQERSSVLDETLEVLLETKKLSHQDAQKLQDIIHTRMQNPEEADAKEASAGESSVVAIEDTVPLEQKKERQITKKRVVMGAKFSEGEFLGRYKILEEIGAGGMGCVYKAHDPKLDRIVALKTLFSIGTQDAQERFLREARAIAKLSHPGIISVYDIEMESNPPFFTMDFIEGGSLEEFCCTPLAIDKVARTIIKIANALHYAHSEGIIHRDIKPANVMIDKQGEPKIMDFGLAKIVDAQRISRSGVMVGTIYYMSPEQANGDIKEVDERSDVYSLGAVLYELLAQRPPFCGNSFTHVIQQILCEKVEPPTKYCPGIPREIEAICLKALSKEKHKRYSSAAEMVADLEDFLQGKPVAAPIAKRSLVNWKMAIVILLILVGASISIATSIIFSSPQPSQLQVENTDKVEKTSQTPQTIEKNGKTDPQPENSQATAIKIEPQPEKTGDKRPIPVEKPQPVLVWQNPEPLFARDYLRRLDGWKKSGKANWAPSEEEDGVLGFGTGQIAIDVPELGWQISGEVTPLNQRSTEGGIRLEIPGRSSLVLCIQLLNETLRFVSVAEFLPNKRRKILQSASFTQKIEESTRFSIIFDHLHVEFIVNDTSFAKVEVSAPREVALYVNKSQNGAFHFKKLQIQRRIEEK